MSSPQKTAPSKSSPTDILAEVAQLAQIRVPDGLAPHEPLWRVDKALFSTTADVPQDELFDVRTHEFFSKGADGLYRIGFWGYGTNSYGFYIHQRVPGCSLFLRLPWGGGYMDNARQTDEINRYLTALEKFVAVCRSRSVEIEIYESMWSGRYRLFARAGDGVEFEQSLLSSPRPEPEFNRMLAAFAVELVERIAPMIFLDDDLGYRQWIARNPLAYVVNCDKRVNPQYIVLHRATCRTISAPDVNYTHGDYQKVCARTREELEKWSISEVGAAPTVCGICL